MNHLKNRRMPNTVSLLVRCVKDAQPTKRERNRKQNEKKLVFVSRCCGGGGKDWVRLRFVRSQNK